VRLKIGIGVLCSEQKKIEQMVRVTEMSNCYPEMWHTFIIKKSGVLSVLIDTLLPLLKFESAQL